MTFSSMAFGERWAAAWLFVLMAGVLVAGEEKPNVIVILTDNLGYGDLGCYGAEDLLTPHLDRMAQEGVRFTDFYASPSCSPSRASLLTGSYTLRCGVTTVFAPRERFAGEARGMSPDEVTIAELLRGVGYRTAAVGKWHLGDHPDLMPTAQGFDEYFGMLFSPDQARPEIGDPPLRLYENTTVVEEPVDLVNVTKNYTERAVAFIERNHAAPFFLYMAHTRPHTPLAVMEDMRGHSPRGLYGDVIAEIDWSVGEILAVLERLGIAENTLVMFTSDNGPWLSYGNHGGSAGGLRGGIGTSYEGGTRVTCVMRWSGRIPAQTTYRGIAALMDFLPTICAVTGASLPGDRVIDGTNLWPALSGTSQEQNLREYYVYYHRGRIEAVRSGHWKLVLPHRTRVVRRAGLDGEPGEIDQIEVGLQLYDLGNDLWERHDLAELYPAVVRRLQRNVADARESIGDLAVNRIGPDSRIGTVRVPAQLGE